ncbi:ankyrin repeat domain-containing protein [Marinomonas agarivorans]|nr:ankyrin repeat domain-containing protein [Marinomonas agarivorans]
MRAENYLYQELAKQRIHEDCLPSILEEKYDDCVAKLFKEIIECVSLRTKTTGAKHNQWKDKEYFDDYFFRVFMYLKPKHDKYSDFLKVLRIAFPHKEDKYIEKNIRSRGALSGESFVEEEAIVLICASAHFHGHTLIEHIRNFFQYWRPKGIHLYCEEGHEETIDRLIHEPATLTKHKPTSRLFNDSIHTKMISNDQGWLDPHNTTQLPFFGRFNELSQLGEFISTSNLFSVWAIKGASGSGKTRLTIEFINQETGKRLQDWDVLFIEHNDKYDSDKWTQWKPEKNTLIISDYVYGCDQALKAIFNNFKLTTIFKIRLLVIDHQFDDPLIQDRRWGIAGDGSDINKNQHHFYQSEPLALTATNDQHEVIHAIIASRADKARDSDEVQDGANYLKNLSNAYHPLFAALTGEAIKNGQDFHNWNRRDLIYYYLTGANRIPWQGSDDTSLSYWSSFFICAATIFGEIKYKAAISVASGISGTPEDFSEVKRLSNRITSNTSPIKLRAFEPDLLGESFFLLLIQDLLNSPKQAKQFVGFLSEIIEVLTESQSLELIGFMDRLTTNLLNEDQTDAKVQEVWQGLLEFVDPKYAKGLLKEHLTVSSVLISAKINNALKLEEIAQPDVFDDFLIELNKNIEVCQLYKYRGIDFLKETLVYALYDFDIALIENDSISKMPDGLINLINFYHENHEDGYMEPVLYLCINHLLWKVAFFLITENNLINTRFRAASGASPLMLACHIGNEQAVEVMTQLGADVNGCDDFGKTPLMEASEFGYYNIVSALLEAGANPTTSQNDGYDGMVWQSWDGEGSELLQSDGFTPLLFALKNEHIETFKLLIQVDKTVVNRPDNDGATPLMWACVSESHCSEFIETLIKNGADINMVNKKGRNALAFALYSSYCSEDKVAIFLRYGIDSHVLKALGQSSSFWANRASEKALELILKETMSVEGFGAFLHMSIIGTVRGNDLKNTKLLCQYMIKVPVIKTVIQKLSEEAHMNNHVEIEGLLIELLETPSIHLIP